MPGRLFGGKAVMAVVGLVLVSGVLELDFIFAQNCRFYKVLGVGV